ncbi:crossover junction endonuclease MUS81 isoform X4 [Enhydra lutris kenyoni]|uniref:Crossover junction endonuclease MUS81 n=1 Tax=Enhydra lutris kenyoni TaxID=391180 RepID=A0A2Y9JUS5_ENHLU|nr:crossover junction endonuclease MUS81 isoform X4 [Enhydra lutris kenyoni]
MAAPVRLGRKRPLRVCPNPLFVRWLTEWRDEAASRGRRTQFVFQKALRSLRRYPLPLRSGKEAKILQHFGDRLCHMLDQRLQQHEASGGDHAPISSGGKSPAREGPFATVQDASMPLPAQPKAGGSGSYWPARHSGAREILLLLYREHLNPSGHGFLAKEELLQGCAQKAPRVAPGNTRPWPALRSLLHRNLVLRSHRPARYSLTAEGLELARKLAESEGLRSLDIDIRPEEPPGEEPEVPGAASAKLGASEGSVQQPPLELEPGEYRVLLCVDTGEAKRAGHRPELLLELQRLRVPHMVRKLHVGDFVWVAQETRPRDPARPGELVLDHIVERKRLDDLCSSIIDGRFLPVKALWPGPPSVPGRGARLSRPPQPSREHSAAGCHQHSGEPGGPGQAGGDPIVHGSSREAPSSPGWAPLSQVIDGFFVKRTADLKESAAYLALLTRGLQRLYQGRTLSSRPWGASEASESRLGPSPNPLCSLLTFSDFNAGAIKNKAQSVREVFARQLMQPTGRL